MDTTDDNKNTGADARGASLPQEAADVVFVSTSVDETRRAGALLSAVISGGRTVLLSGDLGAGKTHFVQGMARGLGSKAEVTSPTFNIQLVYDDAPVVLNHFDLYRLDTAQQLEDIGFADALESGALNVIEWGEKFPRSMPDDRLELCFRVNPDDTRTVFAQALGPQSEQCLEEWKTQLAAQDASPVHRQAPQAVMPPSEPVFAEQASKDVSLPSPDEGADIVLAFDTSNEVIALGVGRLHPKTKTIETVASLAEPAHRASNTRLLPLVDETLCGLGVERSRIACVVCGRGPGSFTGVRICMATAKGMASALEVPLYGVSTADAIAWEAREQGFRGNLAVASDAMRKEVYPVAYTVQEGAVLRRNADCVMAAAEAVTFLEQSTPDLIAGDALGKYADLLAPVAPLAEPSLRAPVGRGLLLAAQQAWRAGELDPFDARLGDPGKLLPVYTRLSDAEENERARLARNDPRNLQTGVQAQRADRVPQAHDTAIVNARPAKDGIVYRPLDAASAASVAAMESAVMGSDAWNTAMVLDELPRADRVWWAAFSGGELVGYCGGYVVDGALQILKIAASPEHRRAGIARTLLAHVASDARDLGATRSTLEVRLSNTGAQAFYRALGFVDVGVRPRYYSDREDALIMDGPLPQPVATTANEGAGQGKGDEPAEVAGMTLQIHTDTVDAPELPDTLILAIESSCDETAASVVDGAGNLLADVVASQIDFHARFGGVVPEIASRKHIEAICGVAAEALDRAAVALGRPQLRYRDLSAIAVTYAPGLVGALVVGVAFAKGAAFGADKPFIGVNHLEGHLYANRIATPDIEPPMVVSLVSGGHTLLVHVAGWGDYETLGSTVDDAVGEAFDKVAKALGLGYPGGPVISRLAEQGDPSAITFPRAMMHSGDLRFSLSGVKTAVVSYLNAEREAGREPNAADVAASFQQAVIDVQVKKAAKALEQTGAREFCLGGGVAANPALRRAYEKMCAERAVRLTMPPLSACTDNAGMIALVALDRYRKGRFFGLDADAVAHASLDDPY